MGGNFLLIICENTCHYKPSAAQEYNKNKMPNKGQNFKKNGQKAGTALKFHQIGG